MSEETGRFRKVASLVAGLAALALLMLYMGGVFITGKVGPGNAVAGPERVAPPETVQALVQEIREHHEAVGTVRPRTETRIEAQIQARILSYSVNSGDSVKKGELLIELDNRELASRLEEARQGLGSARSRKQQAQEAVRSAQAMYEEARQSLERVQGFFDKEAATERDLEQAQSGFLQAKANLARSSRGVEEAESGVVRAEKIVEQAEIALGYARITAPKEGQVVRKMAEKGDIAFPGKPLLILQTQGAMRLEALVREGLISRIGLGDRLPVVINAIGLQVEGTVEEVVPSADPHTRSFLVKVDIPDVPGVYPGMFGRLLVPLDTRRAVTIPESALIHVGQLEMVLLKEDGGFRRVLVKTGQAVADGRLEVLSGLSGGETLGLDGHRTP
ncbi:MAG: efflux RND transporter periplasmic adaptor subunit [Proteobacteria bacterium]|nr:efflux RND transporter periplasmic adaptor subunit [Pseudomonadota bacterium]